MSVVIEDVKHKSAEERLNYFQEKLSELIKLTDITQTPFLFRGIVGDQAQIIMLDLQNPDMLKKYGLRRVEETPADASPGTPENPLAN